MSNSDAKALYSALGVLMAAGSIAAIVVNAQTGESMYAGIAALSGFFAGICGSAVATIHFDYEGR